MSIGLERNIVDRQVRDRAAEYFSALGIRLPRLQDLADPRNAKWRVPSDLVSVDPDSADARNLFRVHWHNAADRRSLAGRAVRLIFYCGSGWRSAMAWSAGRSRGRWSWGSTR